MNKILNKLLSARFLVTVMVSATFCLLALKGKINSAAFMGTFGMIVTFYFSSKKRKGETDEKNVN